MSILLNDNLNVSRKLPVDARYGPWNSVALAKAGIPDFQRYKGLTVGVLDAQGIVVSEYWFNDGITDDDLVLKTSSGGAGVDGATGATGAAGSSGATGPSGVMGATGVAGINGATGPSGAMGATGLTGTQGLDGATGAAGLDGATGPSGAQGSTGAQGASGLSGAMGATGPEGPMGATGQTGLGFSVFTTGDTLAQLSAAGTNQNIGQFGLVKGGELYVYRGAGLGATGPASAYDFVSDLTTESLLIGATGQQGASGMAGETGATGQAGLDGATGPSGAQGSTGVQGASGPSGAMGATGAAGIDGATGPSGAMGATGAAGIDGATGPSGAMGATGAAGIDGATGPSGAQGATGPSGAQGLEGQTGATGLNGATGPSGAQGASGPQGASGSSGVMGATGATGAEGPSGATGVAGVSDRYETISASTINVDTGSKTLITTDKNLNYTANQTITVSSIATPSVYMTGIVVSYNKTSGELVFTVTNHNGSGDVTNWSVNLSGPANGAMGATGATGVQGPTGASGATGPNAANSLYSTSIASSVQSVLTGGAEPAYASEWQSKTIIEVLDTILFPTKNPTYTNPTLSLNTSQTGVKEVGTTVNQTLTLVGTKNDAGAFTSLTVSRTGGIDAGVLATTNSPVVGSATNIDDQYGYTNPNNPNQSYTLTFNESYVVALGTTTLSGKGDYSRGLAKKNNKGVDDTRNFEIRSLGGNPQEADVNFASDSDTITGIYPYYWGKSSTQPSAADVAEFIRLGGGGQQKVTATANGTITITFAATNHYIWFALPTGTTRKTKWYNTGLNNGNIGAGQFILAPVEHDVTSQQAYWSNIGYDIYISAGASATVGSIEFRNS